MDHQDLEDFIDLAKVLKLEIAPDLSRSSQVEILDYTKPTEAEIAHSSYFVLDLINPVFRTGLVYHKGIIRTNPKKFGDAKGREFGSFPNLPHLIFVRGSVKNSLESANLNGLALIPVECESGTDWDDEGERLFLLWSSVQVPSCAMNFRDLDGNILKSSQIDWIRNDKRWFPVDGYEVSPILKYEILPNELDIGISKERIGSTEDCYRRILYSRKAKDALERIGMITDWSPIKVAAFG